MPGSAKIRYWLGSGAIAAAGAAMTLVFVINLCDWIFDCGCRSWWDGAVDMCNVHNTHPPRCPWCANGEAFFNGVLAAILIPQTALAFLPARWPWAVRFGATLAAFPAVGWMVGLLSGWYFGYWSS
ncbi:MAG: hypothetical protein U5J83_16140 [Bryobacterales bacterium]|nr:hypothetical protein [Bryobacterales bacterium]